MTKTHTNRTTPLALVAAAGAALALTGAAGADPQLINISGSTLLRSFINAPAATNDFIGVAGAPTLPPAQLVPSSIQNPSGSSYQWFTVYRSSGAVNGFNELLNYGSPAFMTGGDNAPGQILGNRPSAGVNGRATDVYANAGSRFVNTNNPGSGYNQFNPFGSPYRAATSGADRTVVGYQYDGTGAAPGGVTMDVAYVDAPTYWGLAKAGTPGVFRKPTDAGYGLNPKLSINKDGSAITGGGLTNALPPLAGRNLAGDPLRNTTTSPYDANTVFELPLTLAVIAPVTNYGTGLRQIKMTELQHLFVTGRAKNGENFVVSTRNIDSGTRNAFMNSIGIDPSWGVGDNVGLESVNASENQPGAAFYPTNKGATAQLRETVKNNRLAIGYLGADGGVSDGWLTPANRQIDILDTQNDVYAGATADYVRPTLARVLSNNAADASVNGGWVINGQAVIATIGDSLAEPAGVGNGGDANGNPAMVNKAAAKYVNNIYKSILAFNNAPTAAEAQFSPGEFLATKFVLLAAVNNITPIADPTQRLANTPSNNPRQPKTDFANMYTNGLTGQVFKNTAYGSFSTTSTGLVPLRVTAANTYSDKDLVPAGDKYIQQDGTLLTPGSAMPVRNKIAFDFNGDGVRSLADVNDMVKAWKQRFDAAHPVWAPSDGNTTASIELLGDADSNGSFDAADVRYWADGLALKNGKLDRKAGFKAVDDAFGGGVVAADGSVVGGTTANFFGTVLANPLATWTNGASRADVIGPTGKVAPGWAPVGADGRVDAYDIDYVYRQIRANGGPADWSNLQQAAKVDLSADINGDLLINQADVTEILNVLQTRMGDVNLDGKINLADRAIVVASIGSTPSQIGWATGDVSGDGVIDQADLNLVCPADFNRQNGIDLLDIFAFLNAWFAGNPTADFNNANGVELLDIFAFLNAWFAGTC